MAKPRKETLAQFYWSAMRHPDLETSKAFIRGQANNGKWEALQKLCEARLDRQMFSDLGVTSFSGDCA